MKINKIQKNYWIEGDTEGFHEMKIPLKEKVYRMISDHIRNRENATIMDYGCGLANQIKHLEKHYEIGLYDIDFDILKKAQKTLDEYNNKAYDNPNQIPSQYYDAVIFGLVMMCLKDQYQLNLEVRQLSRIKKPSGLVYCVITHPAFREAEFSYFKNLIDNNSFDYRKNGSKYSVLIKENNITFSDYHWNLSNTIDVFLRNDLNLIHLSEIEDELYMGNRNDSYPPYMLLIFN
jgi:SAM-dependent methyltransferase